MLESYFFQITEDLRVTGADNSPGLIFPPFMKMIWRKCYYNTVIRFIGGCPIVLSLAPIKIGEEVITIFALHQIRHTWCQNFLNSTVTLLFTFVHYRCFFLVINGSLHRKRRDFQARLNALVGHV